MSDPVIRSEGEVFELARRYFPRPKRARDPLVHHGTDKGWFFTKGGGWRDVPPVDFKVYRKEAA